MVGVALATLAAGLATAAVGLTPVAIATPTDSESAQSTIDRLEADGFHVIVNKIGTGPLDQCTTTAVRPGRDITNPGTSRQSGSDPSQIVRYTTVYVDVKC